MSIRADGQKKSAKSQLKTDHFNTPSLIQTLNNRERRFIPARVPPMCHAFPLYWRMHKITVGFGISPNPAPLRLRTLTAGRESHPALKTLFYSVLFFKLYHLHIQNATKI